jgi:uncharacterized OsmC-like protein
VNPRRRPSAFEAENRWVEGPRNESHIERFAGAGEERAHPQPTVVRMDEPEVLLGKDEGANPAEHLLSALAGCLTTSLV